MEQCSCQLRVIIQIITIQVSGFMIILTRRMAIIGHLLTMVEFGHTKKSAHPMEGVHRLVVTEAVNLPVMKVAPSVWCVMWTNSLQKILQRGAEVVPLFCCQKVRGLKNNLFTIITRKSTARMMPTARKAPWPWGCWGTMCVQWCV